jgi:hypothetical protein
MTASRRLFPPRPIGACAGIYPAMEHIYSLAVACYKFRKWIAKPCTASTERASRGGTSYNRDISQLLTAAQTPFPSSTASLDLLVDHWDGSIDVPRAVEFD